MLVGITVFVLIEFALTGFLETTLVARLLLLERYQRWYPFACTSLYLIHSTIFFVVTAGNSIFRLNNLAIQISGALVTLLCSWAGNRLVNKSHLRTGLREQASPLAPASNLEP